MDKLKLLLADDETIVRLGIRHMILWDELGLELVGECANGEEAVRIVQQRSGDVDILLTDTMMPAMDGLHLAAWMQRNCPRCAVIFFSGYAEYDILRTAMRYKAADYLLKPVDRAGLNKALAAVAAAVRAEKTKTDGHSWRSPEAKMFRNFARSRISMDDVLDHSIRYPVTIASVSVPDGDRDAAAESLARSFPTALVARDDKPPAATVFVLFQGETPHAADMEHWIAGSGLRVSVGLSLPVHMLEELPQAYQQARKALLDGEGEPGRCTVFSNDYQNNVVIRLMAYVEENYTQPVILSEAAEHFGYNASYVSRIFKKQTGESFVSYLTRYRITRAHAMLAHDPNYKIAELAEAVGIPDVNYFCKVFKKTCGATPYQFKQDMAKQKSPPGKL